MGPQGRSGQVRKISLPPEFDPRTVQPVASRYIDSAIPAPVKQGLGPELRDVMHSRWNVQDQTITLIRGVNII